MNFLTVRSSEEGNEQEEEQAAELAELLVEFGAVTRAAEFNNDSVRLVVIALFLERWELIPAPEKDRYLRALYAFDFLKVTLDVSLAQAKLLRLSEIRSRILLELKLIESHFLGYDSAKVASIGKERGVKTAIAVVHRLFQDGEAKFAEKLRRLAAELEVVLNDPEQGLSEAGDEGEAIARILIAADDNMPRIITVIDHPDLNVDDKLRALSKIDTRYFGKKSPELGKLFKVSAPYIRGLRWWKVDRRNYLREAQVSLSE